MTQTRQPNYAKRAQFWAGLAGAGFALALALAALAAGLQLGLLHLGGGL